jgi:Ser/Thr protein kinase RdoA (MazF antagonist)
LSLKAVAAAFGVEAERIRLLKRSANTHWAINSGDERYVLRRFGDTSLDSALWEHALTSDLVAAGYPALASVDPPTEIDGELYALYPFARGKTWRFKRDEADYHALGRMLAEYHQAAAKLAPRAQRFGWTSATLGALPAKGGAARRTELLARLGRIDPDMARIAERVAEEIAPRLAALPPAQAIPIHGDFSDWNLRIEHGSVSALFDFNFSYLDSRAVDLAFSRRGYHDAVVRGYSAHAPISNAEVEAIDALWLGIVLRGLWLDLERTGADGTKGMHRWTAEQLVKTRPYRA